MIAHRAARESDYPAISAALADWWTLPGFDTDAAKRERAALVPRLWLQHFAGTSVVAERDGALVGFLIGFLSADRATEAYIHFVGVAPAARGAGVGRTLYERFFEASRAHGRTHVRCVTTPTNSASIAFHAAMGFRVEPGGEEIEGVTAKRDYDGPGMHRVAFVRDLARSSPPT
jgi:predicted GNAT superfamily acetyltransferase